MNLGQLFNLAKSVDRLLNLEDIYGSAIARLSADLNDLNRRVTRLEAGEDLVAAEARGAAGTAAASFAAATMGDLSRRVGMLEAQGGQAQLPPS